MTFRGRDKESSENRRRRLAIGAATLTGMAALVFGAGPVVGDMLNGQPSPEASGPVATVVATIGVAESALVMKEMIEMYADLIIPIFVIMATGFVILTLPLGMVFTWWSKRAAVLR